MASPRVAQFPARIRSDWSDDEPQTEGRTVFEVEPESTGLLDARGNPLVKRRQPIGFRLKGC